MVEGLAPGVPFAPVTPLPPKVVVPGIPGVACCPGTREGQVMLEPGDELGRLVGRALGRTLEELGRYPELLEGAGTVRTFPELGEGDEREGEEERWKLGVERLPLLGRKELPLDREKPPLDREGLLVRELEPDDPREPR